MNESKTDFTKLAGVSANRSLGSALLVVLWVLGIKIATGFWAVFFAIFTPYGWYLAVEAIAKFIGVIV